MNTNYLLDQVEPSKSVTLLARIRKLQEEDPSILDLTAGEPDFDTPKEICQEALEAMQSGCTHYADSRGDAALRAAISRKLTKDNHAPYQPEQILVTPGAKYAIYLAVQALVNPGDEVLWLAPGWVSYPAIVTLCGGRAVQVTLQRKNHYKITRELLEEKVSDKTKLLLLNYPNNPTGCILSREDLAAIKEFLQAHPDIYCVSDEIYEKLLYDKNEFLSPSSDPDLFERCLVVNGFSKASAMTGWRIGYLACSKDLYPSVLKIFQHSMSCTNSFVQKAAIKALDLPQETERMRLAYEARRDLIWEALKDVPKLHFEKPQGTFYAWMEFETALDAETVCTMLLEKERIGGIPGSAYGVEDACLVRFCFAKDEEILRKFVTRLKHFCETYLQ